VLVTARDLIRQRFVELSPALQLGARFLLDHPNEVVVASMRSIAERAGVPPATLVRLAQALGFDGWPGLKEAFVADMGLASRAYGQRAKNLQQRRRDQALTGEMFAAQRGLGYLLMTAIGLHNVNLIMAIALLGTVFAATFCGLLLAIDRRIRSRT